MTLTLMLNSEEERRLRDAAAARGIATDELAHEMLQNALEQAEAVDIAIGPKTAMALDHAANDILAGRGKVRSFAQFVDIEPAR